MPLAVAESRSRQNATATMGPEDVLVLYSDGLVERRGESIDTGLARLADAVARAADGSVAALADRLLRDLVGDGSGDDVVVIVKRLQG